MKRFILFSLLLSVCFSLHAQRIIVNGHRYASPPPTSDSAQFTFSWDSPNLEPDVAGWVRIAPNPNAAILTGSQNGYSISTIATGDGVWNDNNLSAAAGMVTETTDNPPFPAGVGSGYFFNASTSYPAGGNLRITVPDAEFYYDVYVWCNRPQTTDNRQCRVRCVTANETRTRTNINAAPSTASSNDSTSQVISGGTWVRFKDVRADGSNNIILSFAAETGNTFGYVNAVKIVMMSQISEPAPIAYFNPFQNIGIKAGEITSGTIKSKK